MLEIIIVKLKQFNYYIITKFKNLVIVIYTYSLLLINKFINYLPKAFQPQMLYEVFIYYPFIALIDIKYNWGKFYSGIKKTSILSSFFIIDILLYIYSFFSIYTYYTLWFYLLFIKFLIGLFCMVYFKSKKQPLICLYTYLVPCNVIYDCFSKLWASVLNPYWILYYIIFHTIYKKLFPKITDKSMFYKNILTWLGELPCLIIKIIIMYILFIQIFLPTAILYLLFKVINELLNKRWIFLFDQWFKLIDHCVGLIIIINSSIVIYFIFFYNIINITFLFKICLFIWWLGRLLNSLIFVKGSYLAFGNTLSLFFVELHGSYKGRIIGLNYCIIPYSNENELMFVVNKIINKGVPKIIIPSNIIRAELVNIYTQHGLDYKYHPSFWYKLNDIFCKVTLSSHIYNPIIVNNIQLNNTNLISQIKTQFCNIKSLIGEEEIRRDLTTEWIDILPESDTFILSVLYKNFALGSNLYGMSADSVDSVCNINNTLYSTISFMKKYDIKDINDLSDYLYEVSSEFYNDKVNISENEVTCYVNHIKRYILMYNYPDKIIGPIGTNLNEEQSLHSSELFNKSIYFMMHY